MITNFKRTLRIIFICTLLFQKSIACSIFSGIDKTNQVWFGNNEDFAFSFKNYINIFPKSPENKYGYFTFSRDTPENGNNAFIAGGLNEAGLAFDFNSTENIFPVKNMYKKIAFPQGDNAILPYILGNLSTTQEVIDFFEKYWFQFGFRSSQMHVADKYGNLAIISPNGVIKNNQMLISTNFDLCVNNNNDCWRYNKANDILKNNEINYDSMVLACSQTAEKGANTTVYSSIYNLNKKEITLFFAGDYKNRFKISLKKLLKKGKKSIPLTNLFKKNNASIIHQYIESNNPTAAIQHYFKNVKDNKEKDFLLPNVVYYYTRETNNILIYDLLKELQKNYAEDIDIWLLKAIYEYQKGEKSLALSTLNEFENKFPDYKYFSEEIRTKFQDKNYTNEVPNFNLKGYHNAKSVFLKYKPFSSSFYPINNVVFLQKSNDGWSTNLKLEKGIYNYSFIVDGEEIFDNSIEIYDIQNLIRQKIKCHQKTVGFTKEQNKIKLTIQVPNEEDVVYITGNQEAAFQAPLIMLQNIGGKKREIEINAHLPLEFSIVTGGAVKKGQFENKKEVIKIDTISDHESFSYKIIKWN